MSWLNAYPLTQGQATLWNRAKKLREDITQVPLSAFTAGDFEALYRIMGIGPDDTYDAPKQEDVSQLEQRLVEYNKTKQ